MTKSNFSNNRPISVIPSVAKNLESAVKEQLLTFLMHNNLSASQQFAYVKGRSTLHLVTENWLNAIDIRLKRNSALLDLSKCFDSVPDNNHISAI